LNLKIKFLRGGLVLSTGYAIQQALLFGRNVLIARFVGPDDFGILVTFLILISALEMGSDLGVELYLIRAPNGDEPIVQNTLHTVLVARGFLLGLAIFLAADLTAWLFNVPEAVWAYRMLAIVPVLKGFLHLDIRRMQRGLAYYPTVGIALAGTTTGTAVALVLGYTWRSYEAMLWAFVADAAAMVAASHIFAERRYRFDISTEELRSLFNYGWPLLLNGVALFLMGQGDRSIIGSHEGIRDLANYAIAAMLTGGPTLLIIRVSGALFLPLLSGDGTSSFSFARRYDSCGALMALSAFAVVVFLCFYGAPLAELLYGKNYNVSLFIVAWLAVVAGARILRSWPQSAALALGNTRDVLIANTLPISGFLLAITALHFGYGALGVAISIAAGEVVALLFALERSDRETKEGYNEGRKIGVLFLLLAASSMMTIGLFSPEWTNIPLFLAALTILLLAVVSIFFISGSARSWIVGIVGVIKGIGRCIDQ
jgi:O-antigen/teichoic acid export membrane protein